MHPMCRPTGILTSFVVHIFYAFHMLFQNMWYIYMGCMKCSLYSLCAQILSFPAEVPEDADATVPAPKKDAKTTAKQDKQDSKTGKVAQSRDDSL